MGKDTTRNIEEIIRRLGVRQLEALSAFIPSGEASGEYISVGYLKESDCIHTADSKNENKLIGGILSGLAKTKTENGPLILPAGKDEKEGMRWVLNQKVITREQLKDILLEIPGIDL